MRKALTGIVCGVLLAAMGALAYAGFATTDDAIAYRKAVMTVIGEHFGRIAAVVTGQVPFKKDAVEHDAMVIRTMAELPWDAFMVPGSEKGKTTLKAKALEEKDQFMAIAKAFEQDTRKLSDVAKSGDLKAIGAQFGQVAKNCKTCHTTYRNL